jgi:hypothetical protein
VGSSRRQYHCRTKVKHYEIATYGTLHAFAKHLRNKAANLLAISLQERADATLTGIANTSINPQAFKADSTTLEAKNLLNLLKPVLYRLFFIQIDCLLAHSI